MLSFGLTYTIQIWYIILWSNFHSEYEIYLSNFIFNLYLDILKSFPLHKRDKINNRVNKRVKKVSKRFQNYQSLPILQGCWKNWYIILLYICKKGVRIVHIYYTWSSKFLFRWNFKLNVLYPFPISIHIRKSLPNIHGYGIYLIQKRL